MMSGRFPGLGPGSKPLALNLSENFSMHIQWSGLFFMVWGAFAFLTSVLRPETYRWNFRSSIVEALLGKIGARLFFGILGAGLFILGIFVFLGVIRPAH